MLPDKTTPSKKQLSNPLFSLVNKSVPFKKMFSFTVSCFSKMQSKKLKKP